MKITIVLLFIPLFLFCQYKEICYDKIKVKNNIFYLRNKALNGKYKIFNKKNRDKVYEITFFSNGIKNDSLATEYYFGEEKKGKYIDGVKEGNWITKSDKGKITEIINYNDGYKNGYCTKYNYYDSETIIDSLTYKNDKLEGWQKVKSKSRYNKTLYVNGELKRSITKQFDNLFTSDYKYFKIKNMYYYYGKEIRYKKEKKITDSSIIHHNQNRIQKIIYTKLNDSLYHKIEISKNLNNDEIEVKFYDKNKEIYMKYLFKIYDAENNLFGENDIYNYKYDENNKTIKVKISNACNIWREIGKYSFKAFKYESDEEKEYDVGWISSDGDMLADDCFVDYIVK